MINCHFYKLHVIVFCTWNKMFVSTLQCTRDIGITKSLNYIKTFLLHVKLLTHDGTYLNYIWYFTSEITVHYPYLRMYDSYINTMTIHMSVVKATSMVVVDDLLKYTMWNMCNKQLYIYYMLVREIWKFIHPRVSYSPRASPSVNMIHVGK